MKQYTKPQAVEIAFSASNVLVNISAGDNTNQVLSKDYSVTDLWYDSALEKECL